MQVDEIMLTLKQAFSKAVEWKKSNTQRQQCDNCPLLQFHRLCERIEGENQFLLCYSLFEKTQITCSDLSQGPFACFYSKQKNENLIVFCMYFS